MKKYPIWFWRYRVNVKTTDKVRGQNHVGDFFKFCGLLLRKPQLWILNTHIKIFIKDIYTYKIIWDFPTKLTIPCSTVAVKAHRNKTNGTSRRNSPLLENFRGRRQKKVCRQSRNFHNVKGPQIANQMGLANQARLQ